MKIKNALKALLVTLIIVSSTQTQAMDPQQPAEEQARRDEQARLLFRAVKDNNIVEIRALIAARANLNIQKGDGWTALMDAALYGHTEIARALIAAGADLDIQNIYGNTALIFAAASGRIEIAQALIAAGAGLNIQDRMGWTALMWATSKGHIEIVQALIAAGADLNLQNGYGNTALMEAVSWGKWVIVELILDALYLREVRKPFLTSHMAINQLKFGPEKKGKITHPLLKHLKSYVAPELPTYQWLQKKLGRRYPEYRRWKRTQPGYERFDENYNGAGPA